MTTQKNIAGILGALIMLPLLLVYILLLIPITILDVMSGLAIMAVEWSADKWIQMWDRRK